MEQAEEKSNESSKTLLSKDSEILSLRLKLDNLERATGDQRVMSSELAERYGDAQRELTRSKNTILEQGLHIEEVQRELQRAISATSGLASEAASSQAKAEENRQLVIEAEERIEQSNLEWEAKTVAFNLSYESKISELQFENENLIIRLKAEDDTAKALEDYKKRAQIALKKANASSSTNAAESAQLERALSETKLQLVELENNFLETKTAFEAQAQDFDSLQKRSNMSHERNVILTQEKVEVLACLESERDSLKLACMELSALKIIILEGKKDPSPVFPLLPVTYEIVQQVRLQDSPHSFGDVLLSDQIGLSDPAAVSNILNNTDDEMDSEPTDVTKLHSKGSTPQISWAAAAVASSVAAIRTPSSPKSNTDNSDVQTVNSTLAIENHNHDNIDTNSNNEGFSMRVKTPSSEQLFYINKVIVSQL